VIAALALEPIYYSRITGRLRLPAREAFEAFHIWREGLPVMEPLDWLSVDADWLRNSARDLLWNADRFDPLGSWAEVIAATDNPDSWSRLKSGARNAIDLRLVAELLLSCHDALVVNGKADPLPAPPPRTRSPFDLRLKRKRPLDEILKDFGLSPHPHVVVVLEEETEWLLFPRVMALLGLRTEEDFIAIEHADGAGRDLAPLVAYAAAPRLVETDTGRYAELTRPPTRIFVVFDPEESFATAESRRKRRQQWTDRLMRSLPRGLRTPRVREQLDRLVEVATWKRTGESFEFAHFTDLELARAIERLHTGRRAPNRDELLARLAQFRRDRRNLKKLVSHLSKVDLADELWPVLERKISRALERKTDRRIPIVRIVDTALSLAHEYPRRNLVISLEPKKRAPRGTSSPVKRGLRTLYHAVVVALLDTNPPRAGTQSSGGWSAVNTGRQDPPRQPESPARKRAVSASFERSLLGLSRAV
jgi:hypothetical protein